MSYQYDEEEILNLLSIDIFANRDIADVHNKYERLRFYTRFFSARIKYIEESNSARLNIEHQSEVKILKETIAQLEDSIKNKENELTTEKNKSVWSKIFK